MTEHLNLKPHDVIREDRADGSVLLRSAYPVGKAVRCTGDWLDHWAATTPNAVFLAERDGEGWREVTYAEAQACVHAIASHLIIRDLGPERPILVLSGNGVDHGLLTLAAQYVGIPTVPVAEQYALIPEAHPRLEYAARLTGPGALYAVDGARYATALELDVFEGLEVITSRNGADWMTQFEDLLTPSGEDIGPAARAVGHDTLAKILLTSGSTSDPKGVCTTQGMMCHNQAQIAACLPFVTAHLPRLVDWLPWNHVFGGSYNFNLVLANGGSLYIDDGKPAPGLFDRTLENLRMQSGTISFNVPVGFAQLVAALEEDEALRGTYFADLDMIFYAGASLPQKTWDALERLAAQAGRALPLITTSWGLTETAPGALIAHQPSPGAGMVGVPMPGVEVKLVPLGAGRYDVRVRGENVFQGYLDNPAKTQEAFDEEGFFITDDAMVFVDEAEPSKGLRFDGRLSEDFKLSSGTRVQAAALRLEVLAALAPLAQDVVIAGEARDMVGALILPNRAALAAEGLDLQETGGLLRSADLEKAVGDRLAAFAKGKSMAACISRALILSEPPSMAEGEATAKGNINFPKLLKRRADLVERLFAENDPAAIEIKH
ncbi:MAG: feruloyl-CoA synthase [Sulfitobacter sp.]|nr:feruloyl-CoA synthase [Sulfitobacter sp.]